MIRSFSHRGLRRAYERGDLSKVHAAHRTRIAAILSDLDVAEKASDLDLPRYQLHPLKGGLAGFWSIRVSGNWRITFRLEGGDAYDVNLVDYH
jgi:proteic killer suppression protein